MKSLDNRTSIYFFCFLSSSAFGGLVPLDFWWNFDWRWRPTFLFDLLMWVFKIKKDATACYFVFFISCRTSVVFGCIFLSVRWAWIWSSLMTTSPISLKVQIFSILQFWPLIDFSDKFEDGWPLWWPNIWQAIKLPPQPPSSLGLWRINCISIAATDCLT